MNTLTMTTTDTPVGQLTLVASDKGLRAVLWPDDRPDRVRLDETQPGDHPVLTAAVSQLDEYFAGSRRQFDLPLDPSGTEFQRSAWDVLRTIPYGETLSYGEQAARMGRPSAARAVGAANGANPLSIIVPCHRVVASNGKLTGFAGGLDTKALLLEHEQRVTRSDQSG